MENTAPSQEWGQVERAISVGEQLVRLEQEIKDHSKLLEMLIHQIDKRFEQVDKRFEQSDKRLEDLRTDTNKRFEELRADMNTRFRQMLYVLSGVFAALAGLISYFGITGG